MPLVCPRSALARHFNACLRFAIPLRIHAVLCHCDALPSYAVAVSCFALPLPRLALLMLHMRNGVEHKEHDFCAQCGKHARHKRVYVHRLSPPLRALSRRVIMAEKGGAVMRLPLGPQLKNIEQEAELEFRESIQNQMNDERRLREESDER